MDRDGEHGRKRILLTGATGFVGRHVHRSLLGLGHAMSVVVRSGTASRLTQGADNILESADLFGETTAWWATACRDVDTVVHAAWFVEPSTYLNARQNLICLAGSHALALGALDAGVKHFIGLGTCFEYSLPSSQLTVASPTAPTTLYAATKLALFQTLTALFMTSGTDFSWLRLFYLYGDGERAGRLVPHIRRNLAAGEEANLSAGTQVRDFLDVRDAGAMIAQVVATRQPGAINVCSGVPTTVRQLAERIADEYGRRDLLRFGAAATRLTDPAEVVGVCNLEHEPSGHGRSA